MLFELFFLFKNLQNSSSEGIKSNISHTMVLKTCRKLDWYIGQALHFCFLAPKFNFRKVIKKGDGSKENLYFSM